MTTDPAAPDPAPWHVLERWEEQVEVWRMTETLVQLQRCIRLAEGGFELIEAPSSPLWLGCTYPYVGVTEDGHRLLYVSDPPFFAGRAPAVGDLPEWAAPHHDRIVAFLAG